MKIDLNYIKDVMIYRNRFRGSCEACPVSIYISAVSPRESVGDNCFERILFTLNKLKIVNKKVPEKVSLNHRGVKCHELYDWFLDINERACKI